jgi:hypothetical protein
MQAWWAAESVMLTQGSIGSAWAGGMQRGASAMAAAADAPSIALFISSSFLDPLMAAVSHFVLKDHWRLAGRTLGERGRHYSFEIRRDRPPA